MSTGDVIRIVPEGGCFRIKVVSKGSTCTKSDSTLRAAANDALSRGLIEPGTANALIMRGIRETHGCSDKAVQVDVTELGAHSFVCS